MSGALFTCFGPSGAGKSTLIRYIKGLRPETSIIAKDTDRPCRPPESPVTCPELRFVSQEQYVQNHKSGLYFAAYQKFGHHYAIRKSDFKAALKNNRLNFVIVRDLQAIRTLKAISRKVLSVFIFADPAVILNRLMKRDSIDSEERVLRIRDELSEFVRNINLFDHVVTDFWGIENAGNQLLRIADSYRTL